jgi:iron complex transport system permease protein
MILADAIAPTSRRARFGLTAGLAVLLLGLAATSLTIGAADASPWRLLISWLRDGTVPAADWTLVVEIRMPRLALGLLVGSALAVSGALMQGLFRNPLADPGLVGVSSGAGLGAILAIVLGGLLPAALADRLGYGLVPAAAFLGGWVTTLALYRIATRSGQTSVATMLLAGIAIGALAGAASGLLVAMADDRQLRDLTFWAMGSLAGATWAKVAVAAPVLLVGLALVPFLARGLDALALGEAAAMHLGENVERLKTLVILSVAASTGAAVAVSGTIGFVGIVVPHLVRLWSGPGHLRLLPNTALLGASIVLAADLVARTFVAPAELPIGVVMALIGGPVFLTILLGRRNLLGT